jgi:hypothetical protein
MNTNSIDPRLISLLREMAGLAENASLTGSLEGGARQAIRRYNGLLTRFITTGAVPDGLFEPLSEAADYAQLGVESRLLAAFLEGDSNGNGNGEGRRRNKGKDRDGIDSNVLIRLAPFVKGEDLSALVGEYMQRGARMDPHILTHLAPFLDSDSLGKLLRKHLEDFHGGGPRRALARTSAETSSLAFAGSEPTPGSDRRQPARDHESGRTRGAVAAIGCVS